MTVRDFEHDLVIVACAVSAGIHAALAPEHFAESIGAGIGFAGAAAMLAVAVLALTRRPAGSTPLLAAGFVLAGLLVAYALTATTGLPLVHPQADAVDSLALATKAVEGLGLAAALHLAWRRAPSVTVLRPKGTIA